MEQEITTADVLRLRQFIYNCIAFHVIEEYDELYKNLTDDLIRNYKIETVDGGVIAWKMDTPDTVYIWETKSHECQKGKWARTVIKSLKEIKRKSGAKYIKMDTTSPKVRDFMVKNLGFKFVSEEVHEKKYYVMKQGE